MATVPLNYADAMLIYRRLNQSKSADLRSDLVSAAIRYAELRVRWQQADATAPLHSKQEIDPCAQPARPPLSPETAGTKSP